MLDVIGALFLTAVAVILVFWFIGTPLLAMGFAGPSVENWAWMIVGLVLSGLTVLGWWSLVGTHIHVGFG